MSAVASWAIGPFTRPLNQPVIKPTPALVFDCPVQRQPVCWAENHTFNAAAVVQAGKVHVLFRAEDGQGDDIGAYCSRIGRAVSVDGIAMEIQPAPVLFPSVDEWNPDEWPGGCEDPRIVESDAGGFALYYTMYNRRAPVCIAVATSRDLQTWTKHGPIFGSTRASLGWHKAAGVLQKIQDGRMIAVKIHGRYWMYWGEDAIHLATSTDLLNWTPVRGPDQQVISLITPRRGHFDSALTEVGPSPVLTDAGIVLLYNGKNHAKHGDSSIAPGAYSAGQVLFDKDDPAKVLDRLDQPFLKPEADFEKTGQYKGGTVFIEGLVLFKERWHLYFGAADTYVGVAVADLIDEDRV